MPSQVHTYTEQLQHYARLLADWNAKINLVSRKETEHIFEHHIQSSLAALQFIEFPPGAICLDLGSGGGLPGIPLAIALPDCRFVLLDSIRKKVNALQDMIGALGLKNATTFCSRAEDLKHSYDYVLGRAVMPLANFCELAEGLLNKNSTIVYWSGGDYQPPEPQKWEATYFPLAQALPDPYFETKFIARVRRLNTRPY